MNQQLIGIAILRGFGLFKLYDAVQGGIEGAYLMPLLFRPDRAPLPVESIQLWHFVTSKCILPLAVGLLLLFGARWIARWLFPSREEIGSASLSERALGGLAFQVVGLFVLITWGGQMLPELLELLVLKAGGQSPFIPQQSYAIYAEGHQAQLLQKVFMHLILTVFGLVVLLRGRWLFGRVNVESGKGE